jgi:restriction endonuclease Mrr
MAIPKFSDIFTEVLQVLDTEVMLHRSDLMSKVVDLMILTDDEKVATFGGGTNIARNRVHWALEFLCQACCTTLHSTAEIGSGIGSRDEIIFMLERERP